MKRFIVIDQARMTSSRLPGKVLKKLSDGKSILQLQIERIKQAKLVDGIVLATTINSQDDAIEELASLQNVKCFRGSEYNVLERYYLASQANPSEYVIRVTSDCPFIDPQVIDQSIEQYLKSGADYGSNSDAFPNGMNVEIFKTSMLQEAYLNATKEYEREHVTPYFYTHPELYKLMQVSSKKIYPKYRLTVDTSEDFLLIEEIYNRIPGHVNNFSLDVICEILNKEKELIAINQNIIQKKFNE